MLLSEMPAGHFSNEPPKNQVDRNGKRFPKQFSVKVLKLDDNGSLQRVEKGDVAFRTEYSWIAHQMDSGTSLERRHN